MKMRVVWGGKGREGGRFSGGRYEKAAGCEVNGTGGEGAGRVRASIGSMQRPEQLWKEVSPFSHDPAMGQNSGLSLPGSSHFANIYTELVYADNAYTQLIYLVCAHSHLQTGETGWATWKDPDSNFGHIEAIV